MKKPVWFLVLILFLVPVATEAQATNSPKTFGAILYAEGDEFTVYRGSVLSSFSVLTDNINGMQLFTGDLVQTGPGTFLEIQLIPSQTIVKIAENTSFRLTGIAQKSGSTIDVLYGRILAKVDKTLGGPGFSVRGRTAIAGVRGTEFGYDVVAVPGLGTEPSSQVYCYSGVVNVVPLQPEDTKLAHDNGVVNVNSLSDKPSFDLKADEMAAVYDAADDQTKKIIKIDPDKDTVNASGKRTVVFSKGIKTPIKNFWKNYGIKSSPMDDKTIDERYFGKKTPTASNKPETPGKLDQNELNAIRPAATASNLADSIQPLEPVNPLSTMSKNQYVLAPNALKIVGLIMTITGIIADVAGLSVYTFADDLGSSQFSAHSGGAITISVGAVLSVSGLITYILGLTK